MSEQITLSRALEIVLELAEQNKISEEFASENYNASVLLAKQEASIHMVGNLAGAIASTATVRDLDVPNRMEYTLGGERYLTGERASHLRGG